MTELGLKILLDRYSVKDQTKDVSKRKHGDPLIWLDESGQSQVVYLDKKNTEVAPAGENGCWVSFIPNKDEFKEIQWVSLDRLAFPTETFVDLCYRLASTYAGEDVQKRTAMYTLLVDCKFVPAGSILAGFGHPTA